MLLDRKQFFVRERVAVLKLTDTFDILDPQTSAPIGIAREEPSPFFKFLRLLVNKRMLPTAVHIYETEGAPPLLILRKPWAILHSDVVVSDGTRTIGRFRSKLVSLGGAFRVFDAAGTEVGVIQGDWKGWNFKFTAGGKEIGVITKKWAGAGKELFTSADNYMVSVSDPKGSRDHAALLLAAGIAIDVVYKEK